jgi:small subunit ribosomal protein S16
LVRIRLARVGRKKGPAYRIVVADSRKARDGRFIEILGYYQPQKTETRVQVDDQKALKWLMNGAIPTETVRSILRKAGIMRQFHEARKPAPKQQAAAQ